MSSAECVSTRQRATASRGCTPDRPPRPATHAQCLWWSSTTRRSVLSLYYNYRSFGILSYQHYLGSPFSYRGHRAFGTVAVSIVYLCSYTVTSAVTLPLMLPTQSTTSLFVCLSCQKKKKIKKIGNVAVDSSLLLQVINLLVRDLP